MNNDLYSTPLASRYASDQMLRLFSPDTRYRTWRELWAALAEAEHELGLSVTKAQADALWAHVNDKIDYALVAEKEKEVRHDVMAHIYAFGLDAPEAKGIIHLGATSCYVTDNADLIIFRSALMRIRAQVKGVMKALAAFALEYKALPTLGYTHFQPAQPVTVGKRACLWLQDLMLDIEELDAVIDAVRFLGCRGTTGTEASFMSLFDGDAGKIDELNALLAKRFGFTRRYQISAQTYPRKLDSRILSALSSVAQSAHKFATDIRLLQQLRQIEEPFEKEQIGSSAMAYKRNPMRSERVCSLARLVMANSLNAPMTASVQWFERTLDDSANRRVSIPEAFLATDALLGIMKNIVTGLVVNEKMIDKTLREYLPFIATENLLMRAVKLGGDRQALHEIIRVHSQAASRKMKDGGECDLITRLSEDEAFPLTYEEITKVLDPAAFIGRCPEQVESFVASLDLSGADDAYAELTV